MVIPRLESLSAKISKLVSQEDIGGLRRLLEELKVGIGRFASEQPVDRTPKNETMSKAQAAAVPKVLSTESGAKPEQLAVVQPASTSQEPVPEVLRTLAQSYFSGGPGAETAIQLDRKISDFLRQSRPATSVLQAPSKQITTFISALESVLDAVSSDEWRALIRQSLNQAWQLQSEIEDLQQPASNSLRLRFDFEFYTSSANRNGLMDGIGAGLKKQIAKLDKPVDYFDRQFRALTADTVQKAAEFLDTKVDRQRCNPKVQASLNELLRAGGLEQILPSPRQAFHSVEHKIVKVEPRPTGATEGPSIAQVVARGFRRGPEIVNPALVVVYE
jgi:molecular chaperone GrpE (heat shock protein)